MNSLDAAAEEQQGVDVIAEEQDNAPTAAGRSTERQDDVENAADIKLQRAGLAQRLVDLQATQLRLQVWPSLSYSCAISELLVHDAG